MDALIDFINVKYGLDDPRDPLRARVTKNSQWTSRGTKPIRDQLNSFFKGLVVDGVVHNKNELIQFAKNAGFEITRNGMDYISVKAPGSNKAIRLRGEIYNERFTSSTELANTQAKSAERTAYLAKPEVIERYKNAVGERSAFVEKRFAKLLKSARSGKAYEETRSFYAKSRGKSIEVPKNNTSHVRAHNNNKHSHKDTINDRTRKKANADIARAKLIINDTKQSTDRANRIIHKGAEVLAAGITVIKSANRILDAASLNFCFPPLLSAPANEIADIGETYWNVDSGDAEADKVVNKKTIGIVSA